MLIFPDTLWNEKYWFWKLNADNIVVKKSSFTHIHYEIIFYMCVDQHYNIEFCIAQMYQ